MLRFKITFWTLAYILSSDSILQQVKMEVNDIIGVGTKSRFTVCCFCALHLVFMVFIDLISKIMFSAFYFH